MARREAERIDKLYAEDKKRRLEKAATEAQVRSHPPSPPAPRPPAAPECVREGTGRDCVRTCAAVRRLCVRVGVCERVCLSE